MKTKAKRKRCPNCLDLHDALHKQLYPLQMVLDSIELKMFENGRDKVHQLTYWEMNNLLGAIWAAKDNLLCVIGAED